MHTVGMLKQKGGAGATTIAVHLAVAAVDAGRRVCIVDVDPQRSACSWAAARGSEDPPVVSLDTADLPRFLRAAKSDEFDLVIIDTPPHSSAASAAVARVADLAILPARPSALDLAAMPPTVQIVEATRTRALIVLNACPARAREVEEARSTLEQLGQPVWEGQIGDRTAFRRAIAYGQAVTEAESNSKAADEIRQLWHDVARMLS
jgi:chromosome partitioning protein